MGYCQRNIESKEKAKGIKEIVVTFCSMLKNLIKFVLSDLILFLHMSNEELTEIWNHFIEKHYSTKPRLYNFLRSAEVLEVERRYEVRIPVKNPAQEDWLNHHIIAELDRSFGQELKVSPLRITYLREDGSLIEAEDRGPSPQTNPLVLNSSFVRMTTREWALQKRFPKEDNSYSSELVNVVNTVNAPASVERCKDAIFRIIADERTKALKAVPSFDNADRYFSSVQDSVDIIANELGKESHHYMIIINEIVQTYLTLLVRVVQNDPIITKIKEATRRSKLLYSYPISETTKKRISDTCLEFVKIEQEYDAKIERAEKIRQEQEKAQRLSERIKRYALSHYSIKSGNKRYTSPLLGLFALIILGIGSIVSLFEEIAPRFFRKHKA